MAEAKKNRYAVDESTSAGSSINPFNAPEVHTNVTFEGFSMEQLGNDEEKPKVLSATFTKVDEYGDKLTHVQRFWEVDEDRVEEMANKAWNTMEAKGSFFKGCPEKVEEFIEMRIDEAYNNLNSSIKHILVNVVGEENAIIRNPKSYEDLGNKVVEAVKKHRIADRTFNVKLIKDYKGRYTQLPDRPNFMEVYTEGKPSKLRITDNEKKIGSAANATASPERDADAQAAKAEDTSF